MLSPFDDLLSDADYRERFGITEEELKRADGAFRSSVTGTITDELLYTKKYRYPCAPQWNLGSTLYGKPLPGFFCGGGVLSGFYRDLLKAFEDKGPPYKVKSLELPIPDNLNTPGFTAKDYPASRCSVRTLV